MNAVAPFNFRDPDYAPIFAARTARLQRLRANPEMLPALRAHYRENLIEFIGDWGVTIDPRNLGTSVPVLMPFVLFPRQREWLEWTLQNWKDGEFGITEKSRDVGISWMAIALSCSMCLFYEQMAIGFGSQQQDKVDLLGDPNCLFYKARMFMSHLPMEFRGTWDIKKDAPYMRILFPDTRSSIVGECGDNIGRGGRTAIYWIDEAAHLVHPMLVDASLSATTNCRFDMSSVYGTNNPFAEKARNAKYRKFTFHWRSDPRRDDAWYAKLQEHYDPVTIAQEYNIDYAASVENVLIPSAWAHAIVDAHLKLGVKPSGVRRGALDIADQGKDLNGFCGRHGILVERSESWSGKGADLFATALRAIALCDDMDYEFLDYDSDGMGASCRGDIRMINEAREKAEKRQIVASPFRGSAAVWNPDAQMVKGRLNRDYFGNLKAQSWIWLKILIQNTVRALEGKPCDPDEIISIDSRLPQLAQLLMEISQVTWIVNAAGKVFIDKQPDGTRSPNLADALVICFSPASRVMENWVRLAG